MCSKQLDLFFKNPSGRPMKMKSSVLKDKVFSMVRYGISNNVFKAPVKIYFKRRSSDKPCWIFEFNNQEREFPSIKSLYLFVKDVIKLIE